MVIASPRDSARPFRIAPPAFYGDLDTLLEAAIPDPEERAPLRDLIWQLIEWQRLSVEVVNGMMTGKHNATGTVTLTANQATTTITDPRIGVDTKIILHPTTANAKAEGTPWQTVPNATADQAVLNHANNAQTDRTYGFIFAG